MGCGASTASEGGNPTRLSQHQQGGDHSPNETLVISVTPASAINRAGGRMGIGEDSEYIHNCNEVAAGEASVSPAAVRKFSHASEARAATISGIAALSTDALVTEGATTSAPVSPTGHDDDALRHAGPTAVWVDNEDAPRGGESGLHIPIEKGLSLSPNVNNGGSNSGRKHSTSDGLNFAAFVGTSPSNAPQHPTRPFRVLVLRNPAVAAAAAAAANASVACGGTGAPQSFSSTTNTHTTQSNVAGVGGSNSLSPLRSSSTAASLANNHLHDTKQEEQQQRQQKQQGGAVSYSDVGVDKCLELLRQEIDRRNSNARVYAGLSSPPLGPSAMAMGGVGGSSSTALAGLLLTPRGGNGLQPTSASPNHHNNGNSHSNLHDSGTATTNNNSGAPSPSSACASGARGLLQRLPTLLGGKSTCANNKIIANGQSPEGNGAVGLGAAVGKNAALSSSGGKGGAASASVTPRGMGAAMPPAVRQYYQQQQAKREAEAAAAAAAALDASATANAAEQHGPHPTPALGASHSNANLLSTNHHHQPPLSRTNSNTTDRTAGGNSSSNGHTRTSNATGAAAAAAATGSGGAPMLVVSPHSRSAAVADHNHHLHSHSHLPIPPFAAVEMIVTERDLVADPFPAFSQEVMRALYRGMGRTQAQRDATAMSDAAIAELRAADLIIIGLPRYLHGAPSSFKNYMDVVTRPKVTFNYDEGAQAIGLLPATTPVWVVATHEGIEAEERAVDALMRNDSSSCPAAASAIAAVGGGGGGGGGVLSRSPSNNNTVSSNNIAVATASGNPIHSEHNNGGGVLPTASGKCSVVAGPPLLDVGGGNIVTTSVSSFRLGPAAETGANTNIGISMNDQLSSSTAVATVNHQPAAANGANSNAAAIEAANSSSNLLLAKTVLPLRRLSMRSAPPPCRSRRPPPRRCTSCGWGRSLTTSGCGRRWASLASGASLSSPSTSPPPPRLCHLHRPSPRPQQRLLPPLLRSLPLRRHRPLAPAREGSWAEALGCRSRTREGISQAEEEQTTTRCTP